MSNNTDTAVSTSRISTPLRVAGRAARFGWRAHQRTAKVVGNVAIAGFAAYVALRATGKVGPN